MIIYLFSGPRNISTALMYSFNQRPDTIVMDEPFYGIRVKKIGKKQPFFDEIMLRMECDDAEKIHDEIEENEKIKGNVFVKNMANAAQDMKENRLLKYRHVLLIRDPAETILSLIKINPSITSDSLCLAEQVQIYEWLKAKTKEDPIVIDGNELRRDPAAVLTQTCQKLNLPFTDKMLSWPAGPKSVDGLWAQDLYTEVHASTGFRPPPPTKITRNNIPSNLVSLYDDALPHYQKLLSHSIWT
jgi:hypothetical protein